MSNQAIIDPPLAIEGLEGTGYGSFASGVALTFLTRLLMLAGVVGSSVIVGRWLGPEGLGALAVLNTTVALALQIGSAGLPSANTYFIAKDRKKLGPAWANAIIFSLVAGVLMTIFTISLAEMRPALFGEVSPRLVAIAAISIPFQLLILLALNVLLAIDRIASMNLFDSVYPALMLVNAILVLVLFQRKLNMLVFFNTAAAIMLSFGLMWFMRRRWVRQKERNAFRPDFALLKKTLRYGVKFYISIMASVVIFRADLLVVNHFRSAREAGVYSVAAQVSFLLMILPGVIAMLLFPRVASRQDQTAEYAIGITRHASFVMLITCLIAAAASFLLPLVYGVRFADATIQLLIMLPGIYLVSIESVLVQHFTGTGLPVVIPAFWLITMLVNLGLNLALVPAWGARAAAANSSLSYALIFTLVTAYFCAKTGRRPLEIFLLRSYELRDLSSRLRRRVPAN